MLISAVGMFRLFQPQHFECAELLVDIVATEFADIFEAVAMLYRIHELFGLEHVLFFLNFSGSVQGSPQPVKANLLIGT